VASAAQAIERIETVMGSVDVQRQARAQLATRAALFTTERFVEQLRAVVAGALVRGRA
jgi:hypothetical protein